MKNFVLCFILFSTCLTINTVELTVENFDAVTQEKQDVPWLLFFYAPWSPYSLNFNSTFLRLAHNEKENVHYGHINIMNERELAIRFRLHHYPSLFLLYNNTALEFREKRQYELIDMFIHGDYSQYRMEPIPSWPIPGLVPFEKAVVDLNQWLKDHPLALSIIVLSIGFMFGSLFVNFLLVVCQKEEVEVEEVDDEVEEEKEEKEEKIEKVE